MTAKKRNHEVVVKVIKSSPPTRKRAEKEARELAADTRLVVDTRKAETLGGTVGSRDRDNTAGSLSILLTPPCNQMVAKRTREISSVLGPVVEAMVTNVHSFGWVTRMKREETEVKENPALALAVAKESAAIKNLFDNINPKMTFRKLRELLGEDRYSTGNAYFEVIREVGSEDGLPGRPVRAAILDAERMRISKLDERPIKATVFRREETVTENGDGGFSLGESVVTVSESVRFRRYALLGQDGSVKMWFKEYGDPRIMDKRNGSRPKTLDPEFHATEVVHIKSRYERNGYGLPEWLGAQIAIDCERQSDVIVYSTLRNNNIPSMLITVSGGYMTKDSIDRLTQLSNELQESGGGDNYSKYVVIEAKSEDEPDILGAQAANNVRIGVEKLADLQLKDGLFDNLKASAASRVRRQYRISDIYFGDTGGYNRSTAAIGRRTSEEQVFDPERRDFDEVIDRVFLRPFGVIHHTFESLGTNVTDERDIIDIVKQGEKSGGVTPRTMHSLLQVFLGRKLPSPSGIDLDVPMTFQLAEVARGQGMPPNDAQTAAAAKAIRAMTASDDDQSEAVSLLVEMLEDVVDRVVSGQ